MGTYYSIYAEARVGKKWYNISPLIKDSDGSIKAYPIIDGKSFLSETYDKLKDDLYMCGRPADLSPELREIFDEDDDESYGCFAETYKQHYDNSMFLVNYGKSVKSRVKKDRPFRYQGYVFKNSIAAYEIGEQEEIFDWLTRQEYESGTLLINPEAAFSMYPSLYISTFRPAEEGDGGLDSVHLAYEACET